MGVKNLKTILPDGKRITLKDLKDSKVYVDTSIYLYKYKYAYKENFVNGFKSLLNKLEKQKIQPTFVFDGKPPIEKLKILNNRKKARENSTEKLSITEEDVNNLKEFFTEKEISFIQATGEAEKECSIANKNGDCDYVLSNDLDCFVFGAKKIVRYIKNEWVLLDIDVILEFLGVNFEQFKLICFGMGTDYDDGVWKYGPKKCLSYIKENGSYTEEMMSSEKIENLQKLFGE